jgi:S-formylglutathione hydrolase FrmB
MLDTATGRGADVSAAGGQRGTYTYRWETFLSEELPSWLAAPQGG